MTPKEYVEAKQDKYYHVRNEAEYNWLMKKLEREGYKWQSYTKPTNHSYSEYYDVILIEKASKYLITWSTKSWFSKVHEGQQLIEVSELMKQDDKIIFTEDEKREFDHGKSLHTPLFNVMREINRTTLYPALRKRILGPDNFNELNKAQLEFARAWSNPDLIIVKKPERWAYELKPELMRILHPDNTYLSTTIGCVLNPVYHTAKEWQSVDNKLKVAFKRVYEVKK